LIRTFTRRVFSNAILDRLALPVDDHGLGRGKAGDFHVEDRIVAGLGEKNPRNLLGIHLDGDRVVPRTIQYGGNLARDAHTASGILVELALTGLGDHNFWHSVSHFLVSGTVKQLLAISYLLLRQAESFRSLC
jgi:hypothetical protein